MGFQDVAFLPSWASFHIQFFRGCCTNDLRPVAYLKTVGAAKQGPAPCKVQIFFIAAKLSGINVSATKWV